MEKILLKQAIDQLLQTDDKKEPHVLKARLKHPRSHIAWTEQEDRLLSQWVHEGGTIASLAHLLKRSEIAIEARLKFLGLLNFAHHHAYDKTVFLDQNERTIEKQEPIHESQIQARQVLHYWQHSLTEYEKTGWSLKEANVLKKEAFIFPFKAELEKFHFIISVYDEYVFNPNKKIPQLLNKFCSLKNKKHGEGKSEMEIFLASQHHLGQMQNEKPLSDSQRINLSYLHDAKNNRIFTIQESLEIEKNHCLLAVIASKWVEAAIEKRLPPLLVMASAHQTLDDSLDAFQRIDAVTKKSQKERWLPDSPTYGLCLTSSKKTVFSHIKVAKLHDEKSDAMDFFYTTSYREMAKSFFLEQFTRHYHQSVESLSDCQGIIHQELCAKYQLLKKTIELTHEFYKVNQKIQRHHGNLVGLISLIGMKQEEKEKIEQSISSLKNLRKEWFLYKTTELKWVRLFYWLPWVNDLLRDKTMLFALEHSDVFPEKSLTIRAMDDYLNKKIQSKISHGYKIDIELTELHALKNTYDRYYQEKIYLEQELGFELNLENLLDWNQLNVILDQLDLTLRHQLFILATHYWEAQWLLESESFNILGDDLESRKKYWRVQAMLTPCLITDLHLGPSFFQYKNNAQELETLSNFIDLLIIEKADQVIPAVAGAMVSVAKNLLLTGNHQQPVPVWTVNETTDLENAKKFGLCVNENDYEYLKTTGILCGGDASTGHAYGSVLIIGKRKSNLPVVF